MKALSVQVEKCCVKGKNKNMQHMNGNSKYMSLLKDYSFFSYPCFTIRLIQSFN